MDVMNSISAGYGALKNAQVEQQYGISMQKKAMDVEELALQEMEKMLPPSPYGFDVKA